MNPIDHKQAQRRLHARLDGRLSTSENEALEAHLQTCSTCRQYATQIEKLDVGLRRYFHQKATRSVLRADSVSKQVRATMFSKRIWSFVGSTALLLGLLALLVGQVFLIPQIIPAAQSEYSQTPTAVQPSLTPPPTPTPTPGPLTTAEEIAVVLERLAERNASLYQQPGWVRTQNFDASEGAPRVYYSETWLHYADKNGVCDQSFILTRATPGSEPVQFMVWSAGVYGDLVELRKGRGEIQARTAAEMQCAASADQTPAGDLALRLLGKSVTPRKDAGKNLETAEAHYEVSEGQPVVVVEARFSNELSTPPLQVERRVFSLESGLLLHEEILMQYADGSPFDEFRLRIQTEFYDDPPAETAQLLQQAAAELTALQSGGIAGRVEPTPAPDVLDALPTTPETAISDIDGVVTLLRALRERHVQWLSRPGWYLYEDPVPAENAALDLRYRLLIHTTGEQHCEEMRFFRKGEQVLPQEVRLADGSWGLIGTVENGVFTEGKAQDLPCTVDTLETVNLLDQQIESLPKLASDLHLQARAWVGKTTDQTLGDRVFRGRTVLVVEIDTTYTDPKPRTMDPDTGQLATLERSIERDLYDLETGAILGPEMQMFLQGGKVFNELSDASGPLNSSFQLYQYTHVAEAEPPDGLAEVFARAVGALKLYLGQ